MAVDFPTVVTPTLPDRLRQLWHYLANRDVGPPSVVPVPGATESADGFDILSWSFSETQPPGDPAFRRADGFLLAMAAGDTGEPWLTGAIFRLSSQCRGFVQPGWGSATRSYAIAAYRNTWQGEQATGWVQPLEWKGLAD